MSFQSGYKAFHNTESALLNVFNKLSLTTHFGDSAILMLIDLTAAFDAVDHTILISRLEHCVGIRDEALKWFRWYLSKKCFSITLGDCALSSAPLPCGVPQGSILGPILFSLCLLPLGLIFKKHGSSYYFYADDSQICLPLKPNDNSFLLKCLRAFSHLVPFSPQRGLRTL